MVIVRLLRIAALDETKRKLTPNGKSLTMNRIP